MKIKVLIVEDHPVNMKIIRFMLSRKGCDIYEAENGQIAVDLFRKVAPDMIFMDVQMPVMNGFEATRMIRKREKELGLERTPITALTANAMAEDIEKTKAAGMDYFLSKPVTYDELSKIIDLTPEKSIGSHKVNDNTLFDYKGLVELFSGNEDIINELLMEFVQAIAPQKNKLEEYIRKEDFPSINNSAHSMKGQLLNLRAFITADLFGRLENNAKDADIKSIESCYASCRTSLDDLKETIIQLIAKD